MKYPDALELAVIHSVCIHAAFNVSFIHLNLRISWALAEALKYRPDFYHRIGVCLKL